MATAISWSVRHRVRMALVAGITGVIANLLLIVFYVLLAAGVPAKGVAGSASDLVGAATDLAIIPVAVALGTRLPRRRSTVALQRATVLALACSAIVAPLVVADLLSFAVETPIAAATVLVLAVWLVQVNRWLRPTVPWSRVAGLGELAGGSVLAGAAVVAVALPLPLLSWPQVGVLGVGVVVGLWAYLAIPVWFLLLSDGLREEQHAAASGASSVLGAV